MSEGENDGPGIHAEKASGWRGRGPGGRRSGEAIDYKGYQIFLKARPVDGLYGVGGLIRREIDGEVREHLFIRADQLPSREQCDEVTLQKARQTIDQLGDEIFGSR
ncbi:HlyU family transcriptional regulator [Marinobacterium aestuariivivens]|uniref:HlyU family transcriptional regulator n=1 Tax=Marinobacterium aestuariivivens TaxID=1698799 RepID=A0ABW2A2P1_9GAMM